MLTVLLSTGKTVSKDTIIEQLNCSSPTFNRDLRDIRETYQAEIRYTKANHSFQLVEPGLLNTKIVRHLREALAVHENGQHSESHSGVNLDKDGKKAVSFSLRLSVLRQIEICGNHLGLNRSEVINRLVAEHIDKLYG